jgi:hypothetical protein
MKDYLKAYIAIFTALALIVTSLAVVIVSQPAEAREIEPEWTWRVYPTDRTNTGAYIRMKLDAIEQRVAAIVAEYESEQAAQQAWAEQQAAYYEPTYYAPTYSGVQGNPDGLNSFVGVIEYDGRRETAYSSNVLYHYRTSEWTADAQGFYHDSEGRYVVAASDMEQGTVFHGSMGECIVLDSGCDAGVTDYYTNWL